MDKKCDSCKLDIECLGKGIDATRPQVLLHTQIIPTSKNVERRKIGTGVQDWKYEKLPTVSSVKDKLRSSLSGEPPQIVSFGIGFEMQRAESDNVDTEAIGKQIHNQTVLFDTTMVHGSSIQLVALLRKATKEKGLSYSPEVKISSEERDAICRSVVRDINEGVTHYVSSVDLGAKIYATKKQAKVQEQEQGLGQLNFIYESRSKAQSLPSQVYLVVDPSVELKAENTIIKTEQEKIISYAVKPVWSLVNDPAWRQSVKKACEDYISDYAPDAGTFCNVNRSHDLTCLFWILEEQFLIRAVKNKTEFKYLKMTDNHIEAIEPDDVQHATGFTFVFPQLDSTEEAQAESNHTDLFCIRSKFGDQHFYLTATSADDHEVIRPQMYALAEHAMFCLVHPVTKKLEKVSKWEKQKSFHLVRRHMKTTLLYKRTIEKYLLLENQISGGTTQLVLKEKSKLNAPDTYCLFSLEKKSYDEQFMIKAVCSRPWEFRYLTITDDHIEGTVNKWDAAVFTFVFSDSTENGFYLRSKLGGQHFYLTATDATQRENPPANNHVVIRPRLTVPVKDQAMFFLGHPATNRLEKMSKWKEQESLHLVRHHTLDEETIDKYLLLEQVDDKLVLKEKINLEAPDSYCLFSLEKL